MGIFIWATGSKEDVHFKKNIDQDQMGISSTLFNVSAVAA